MGFGFDDRGGLEGIESIGCLGGEVGGFVGCCWSRRRKGGGRLVALRWLFWWEKEGGDEVRGGERGRVIRRTVGRGFRVACLRHGAFFWGLSELVMVVVVVMVLVRREDIFCALSGGEGKVRELRFGERSFRTRREGHAGSR